MTRAASLASLASPSVLSVDSSDNIGVGVLSPTVKLDVSGDINATNINATNVSAAGTVTYEDVTNVDSVGVITARLGVNFGTTAAGTLVSGNGTGIGIGTAIPAHKLDVISTGVVANVKSTNNNYALQFAGNNCAYDVYVGSDNSNNFLLANENNDGTFTERLRITSGGVLGVNTTTSFDPSATLSIYNGLSGSEHTMLEIVADTNETSRILFSEKGDTNKGSIRYAHGTGGDRLSFHAGTLHTEQVSIGNSVTRFKNTGLVEQETSDFAGTKLGTAGRVSLKNGNVARFTANETGSTSINFIDVHSELAVGDTVSFTVILRPNGAGYITGVYIDSVLIPAADAQLNWEGGSAPSSGSANGYDVYTFQIIKTGGNTDDYLVFASQPTNFT